MKIAIILLSILGAAGVWWHATRDSRRGAVLSLPQKLRIVAKSVVAGVVLYFGLLIVALLYMMATAS
ncbi:hypothetical protein [Eoetvoesiella caeni]|uniref:Uncharacterized protein n=1 Tax=Eoetvoesiella caeni TaxID=645616 RepID=A0A366HGH6_9BURK|nr:hypothetical protein [Eoetvoesiella caeni]MCI2808383.1 hypothetical protein [Eoetvoesiella caeni]NYT54924.1 hypothetical protein [Eoetvoesiella caeni]RBP41103.1 hypothetical protein DFR37_103449 [Eoetvoesiella caeni]